MTPGIGLVSVEVGDHAEHCAPAGKPRCGRVPEHRAVIDFPASDQSARASDSRKFFEGGDGIGHVVQHLGGEDDIEGIVFEGQGAGVGKKKLCTQTTVSGQLAGGSEGGFGGIGAGDLRGGTAELGDAIGQIQGDGSGSAADVQQARVRSEVGKEEGGGILGAASCVNVLGVAFAVQVSVIVRHAKYLTLPA